jgi:hypothetical protein
MSKAIRGIMNFIEQITLPIFIFWILGILYSFFRKDLDISYKLFAVLIFLFYIYQFQNELFAGYFRLKTGYAREIVLWIYGLGKAIYFILLFAWPLALIRIYFTAAFPISELTIKFLVFLSAFYWISFFVYSYLHKEIDHFMLNVLVHFFTI